MSIADHQPIAAERPKAIALTQGEAAGIGPDIAISAWLGRRRENVPAFYLIGDPALMARRADQLGCRCPMEIVAPEEAGAAFATALPIVPLKTPVRGVAGRLAADDADAVIEAIETAFDHVRRGIAAAMVTNPVHKANLYAGGFRHPGHTEFLALLAARMAPGPHRPVMMLAAPGLRTVPVTVHVALSRVPQLLSAELIVETGRIVAGDLQRRFAVAGPRLAIAGLNPHAGEGGALGSEEADIIAPAIARLREMGIEAGGPFAADTLFHEEARRRHDAVLAMYHDQALIPIKTIAFEAAVNVTLGLPFIRTSPDHGTALELAGSGRARPDSLVAAVKLARQLADNDAGAR